MTAHVFSRSIHGRRLPSAPPGAEGAKRGRVLTSLIIEDPPGFLIHEAATTSVLWPMMPCDSNPVLFDQLKAFDR